MIERKLKNPGRFIGCVIVLLSTATASAQEQNFKFELTPYAGYRVGGDLEDANGASSIDLDDNESFGFIFNARHSAVTQWEILYSYQETNAATIGTLLIDPALDLSVEYLHAGGTYLWDGEHVRPYLAATLGGTHINVSTIGFDSDTFFSFSLGLGLQIQPNSRVGIRLEARSFGTLLDSDTDIFCQSSPMTNTCAVRIEGTLLWQFEAFAGLVFRF